MKVSQPIAGRLSQMMQRLRNLHLNQMSQSPKAVPDQWLKSLKMMKVMRNRHRAAAVLRQVMKMRQNSASVSASKGGGSHRRMMTAEEAIKRFGLDPLRFDRRPMYEILDDEIPYERWAREAKDRKA